jgi:hypothetical protein
MATNTSSVPQGRQQPGVDSYEPRDVSVPWIFGIVLFLVCCGIVIELVFSGVIHHLVRTEAPVDAWRPVARPQRASPPPTFPKLQISPAVDLQAFREKEDQLLTTYGWINQSSGIVRVPIERAMDIVLQKGLPTMTNRSSGGGLSPAQLEEQRAAQWRNGTRE